MEKNIATGFPSQKKTRSQKTKKWAQDCVDAGDTRGLFQNDGVRQHRKNKIINFNLYNGKVDRSDMDLIINPHNTVAGFIPDEIPHYPIAAPKIDLLVGEELKRRFDYKVVVTNPDAISDKEEALKELWLGKLREVLEKPDMDEQTMQKELQKFEKYVKYEWQDIREKTSTNILRHYYTEQNFKLLFNQGFKDVCIDGEEIYQCDIIAQEPILHKLNNINVHTIRSGGSNWIQDSDLIILEDYWNPGRVVDNYFDSLKDKDIRRIEEGFSSNAGDDKHTGAIEQEPNLFVEGDEVNGFISLTEQQGHSYGQFFDSAGNIRVLRVYWRSFRKVKLVTYFDENGNEQQDYFPEDYEIDESKGETEKIQWLNEWWEGTKIGEDIYVKMRPKPIQYNRIDNPSKCHPGIIGYSYSTNQFRTVSIMDRTKQYQYLFDVIKDRINKAMAKYLGPLLELDLAKVPDNWEIEKWMHFAVANGIAVVDSFKEGNKGASTGTLAGGMNTTGKVLNLDMGNYIQQHISMLEYIKAEMGEIIGISRQREGQISNRETVGGVERSVNQSSHITEELFYVHDIVKVEVLKCFLETAKVALKNRSKKIQYILGDDSIEILNMDMGSFCDADYGILVNINNKYQELDQVMKELAHAGIQNDKMDFSTLISIYMSDSLSDMRRKIELKEEEKIQSDQQNLQAQQESIDRQTEIASMDKEADRQQEDMLNLRDNMTKIEIKMLEVQKDVADGTVDDDGLPNEFELRKHKDDIMIKMKTLEQDMKKHKDLLEIKKKDLAIKRSKPTTKK